MKQKIYFRFLFAAILLLANTRGFAQGVGNHITMSLENCAQTTADSIEFDLIIMSDGIGSSDLRMNSVSYGINFNTGILPSGASIQISYITGTTDAIFPSPNFSFPASSYPNHIRLTQSPSSNNNGITMIVGHPYRAGRFRLNPSSGNWVTNSSPNFTLQGVTMGGHTNTTALLYIGNASSTTVFNTTGTGDGQRGINISCSLTFYSCSISAMVNSNQVSCPGGNDGSISITPTSGTPPYSYLWNNGATTSSLTALTVGFYYVNVVDFTGCGAYESVSLSVFAPFCNYNIVKGLCFVDYNNNGIQDNGEPWYHNLMVVSGGSIDTFSSSTNSQGHFLNFAADTGTIVTAPNNNTLRYYTYLPTQRSTHFPSFFNVDSVTFAFVPIPGVQDLRITLLPNGNPRPGFNVGYHIIYSNVGTDTMSNNVIMIKDHRLSMVSSNPNYASLNGDSITWSYSNLLPNETRSIDVTLHVPTSPTVNIGDYLSNRCLIEPIASDSVKSDNYACVCEQRVRGAYDPNDKTMLSGSTFTTTQVTNGEYLTYLIRFQNTGTDTAFRVIVSDTLDNKLDGTSFEMISASHNYTVSMENQKYITWTLDNILLPDSNANEPASHGYVAYWVKPKSNVAAGDVINNTANIFFDYNLPVATNTSVTTIVFPNSVENISTLPNSIHLFPNPTNGTIAISYSLPKSSDVRIGIYNSYGQLANEISNGWQTAGRQETVFDVQKLAMGIYFVKVIVDGNATVLKLAKM